MTEPVARAHITFDADGDGLHAELEVLNGEHMQAEHTPVNMYVLPLTINTNSEVSAVLTRFGADILKAYYWQFPAKVRPPVLNAGDTVTDTLWHLMMVFGKHMYNGGQVPFENNEIKLVELR
jgi:hypothetical protein